MTISTQRYSLFALLALLVLPAQAAETAATDAGRKIYLEGVLPSGEPLKGVRFGSTEVAGAEAACVNCHRPSGMGSVEGDTQVSPVASNYLFGTGEDKPIATMDPRVSKRFSKTHDPYTEEALAASIRTGMNNMGAHMNELMPHYEINDADMQSLIAYLRQLSPKWSPGATGDRIHFATVITPDVEPERRKAMLDTMRIIFKQKNGSTITTAKHAGGKRLHMVSAAELVLGTERNWSLDIWELKGAPETWRAQLDAYYRARPVFALVSGLSNGSWEPVHDFCEEQKIPQWFPSLTLPVQKPGQYSLYFSRGVALEAEVLAQHLAGLNRQPKRVWQVYRDDYTGRGAAQQFERAMAQLKIKVDSVVLPAAVSEDPTEALRLAIAKMAGKDSLAMFWLRPDDVVALNGIAPPQGTKSYFSGVLASAGPDVFPLAWKKNMRMVYPYELPETRALNLQYFLAWMNINKLEVVDETLQSEIFFSLNFLTDTLSEMLNNLYRDYLVERGESMINRREGAKVEQEVRDLRLMGLKNELIRKHGHMNIEEGSRLVVGQTNLHKREGTTIYPRLSLGPGQRFASKGAYIVRYSAVKEGDLLAESEWIVP